MVTSQHIVRTVDRAAIEMALTRAVKRSDRQGLERPTAVFGNAFEVCIDPEASPLRYVSKCELVLTLPDTVVGEWRLIAVISPLQTDSGEVIPFLTAIPGCETGMDLRAVVSPYTCAHCNTVRRRDATYGVRNVRTLEEKQVGSTCLADFVGTLNADKILAGVRISVDLVAEISEIGTLTQNVPGVWALTEVIAHTVACVRVSGGWVSRGTSRAAWEKREEKIEATADKVLKSLSIARDLAIDSEGCLEKGVFSRHRPGIGQPTTQEWTQANEIVEKMGPFLDAKAETDTSDYIHALLTLYRARTVSAKCLALACSAYSFVKRAENPPKSSTSSYVGTVGAKIEFNALVVACKVLNGNYGISTMVKFDSGGNVVTWFASGAKSFAVGARVTVSGTVKKHETFRDVAQTVVTRCKVA